MWMLGQGWPDFVYRIPAVLAGTLSVWAFMLASGRRGTTEPIVVGCMMSSSFLLIQYSSEARGYAYLQFFCGVSYLIYQEICLQESKRQSLSICPTRLEVGFGIVCVFGVLSHLTFVEWYAGLFAGFVLMAYRRRGSAISRIASLVRSQAIPLVVFPVVYFFHFHGNKVGGEDVSEWPKVAAETLVLIGGFTSENTPQLLLMIPIVILICAGIARLFVLRDPAFVVLLLASSIVPILLLLWQQFPFVYPRHFLVNVLACLLLCSTAFSWLAEAPRGGRIAAALGLMIFVFGNAFPTINLIRVGRGEYSASLRRIASVSSGHTISLGGDHDFRNRMMVEYFGPKVDPTRHWQWIPNKKWTLQDPEWALLHSFKPVGEAPQRIEASPGKTYFDHDHTSRYFGLSGWNWIVYRRQPSVEAGL